MMWTKKYFFLLMAVFLIFLMGCGKKGLNDVTETTVFVAKNGHVTDAIVESFDKEYYNSAELQHMIDDELADYNESNDAKGTLEVTKYEVEDDVVRAYIEFSNGEAYSDFNDVSFFFGTVKEAEKMGYSIDVTLRDVENGGTIGKEELEELYKYHIVIISEPVQVMTYSKILYCGANVDLIDNNLARVSNESAGLAYLIIK